MFIRWTYLCCIMHTRKLDTKHKVMQGINTALQETNLEGENNMKKQILSMLLAIVMVVGLIPCGALTAFAAETGSEVKWGADADSLTEEGTLADAIAASAAYIQLLKNITYNEQLTINNSVTLDLNGKTLTATGDNGVYVTGDLTITDSSTAGNGSLIGTATGNNTRGVYVSGNLTVKGGSLTGKNNGKGFSNKYGVYVNGGITVSGGSLTGTAGMGDGVCARGDITVSDGSLNGTAVEGDGVYTILGSISVSGGSLTGTATVGNGVYVNGGITVSGGSLTGISTNGGCGARITGSITIEGEGKLTGTGEPPVQIGDEDNSSYTKQSEGTDETTRLPTVVLVAPAVTEYPLWVGGEQFTSEKLTVNGTTGKAVYDPDNDTLTLNNYSYTGEGYNDAAIYYNGANTLKLNLVGDNSVTHSGGKNLSYGVYADNGGIEISGDKLTATGGTVNSGGDSGSNGIRTMGDITILSGTVTATSGEAYGSHGSDSTGISVVGKFTVLGGTVTAIGGKSTSDRGGGSAGIWAYEGITISGGEIIAKGETVAFGQAPTVADTLAPFDEDGKVIGNPDYDQLKYVHIKEKLPVASVTVGSTTNNYTDIQSAVAAAQANSGSTLTLLDNISVNEYFIVESGTFTIDLNGKTWESSKWVMFIGGDANITITDNSTDKEGKLFGAGSSYPTIMLYGNANLEIAGGTVEDDTSYVIDMARGGTPSQAKFTLSGGKLITTNHFSIGAFGSSVTITGGTIESAMSDIYYYTGRIDMSGHSDPTGITIYLDSRIESCDIRLPAGYVLLDKSGKVAATLEKLQTYTVGKPVITTRIKAVNADDEALAGASMQIMNAEGDVIVIHGNEVKWDSTVDNYETVAVDESIHTITGLKPGVTYTLRTTTAPAGYTVPADVIFTVDEHGKVTVTAGTGTVNGDGVLLVKFEKLYTVTVLSTENGSVTADKTTAVEGEIVTLTITPDEGYRLDTLTVMQDKTSVEIAADNTFVMPTGDVTVTATFIPNRYTITFDNNGADIPVYEFFLVLYGTSLTEGDYVLPTPGKTGFTFAGWYLTDEEGQMTDTPAPDTMPAYDMTMIAKWTPNHYSIILNPVMTNGTVDAPADAVMGETVTLTVIPDKGYVLEKLIVDDQAVTVTDGKYTFTMPAADIVVTATFAVCDHTGNTNTDDGNCLTGLVCSVCGGVAVEARENHTGGTATCIAKAECEVCGTEYGSVDADAHQWDNGEVTTDPTCSEVGVKTYICQLNKEHTKTEEVAIDADAHAWSVEYTFASDGSSCTATRVCGNDEEHNVTVDAVITSEETRAPTTDAMGETTYTAEFDVDWAETQTNTVADIPTLNEVRVPEMEDGDIDVDNETPRTGDEVNITVTPEPGKEVMEVIVKDKDGNKLPVTKNEDGMYSYEQPAGDVTIEVIFREESRDTGFDHDAWYRAVMLLLRKQALEEAAKADKPEDVAPETGWQNPFKDVAETDWFYEDVEFVNETGLMIGTNTTGTKFSPEDTLTRAMLVTILWRLESEPVVNYFMQFNDVVTDEWYTEAVRWAAAEGIVNGYGNDTFGPMNAVTREQVMAILHRYAAYKGLESDMIFPMILQYNYSLWAENDILWADMIGLTSDLGVDIFDMKASADRAEIAAYLRRFCEAFMEE